MKSRLNDLFKGVGMLAALIVFLLWIIEKPSNLKGYFGIASTAAGISVFLITIFDKCLWKYIPLNRIPVLGKSYEGTLKYKYNGVNGEKKVILEVDQTYLGVKIILKTDEISSVTITSDLIEENGKYILYYIYLTDPKSSISDINPIQRGTCRLEVCGVNLIGNYWTNRKTIGELDLKKKE